MVLVFLLLLLLMIVFSLFCKKKAQSIRFNTTNQKEKKPLKKGVFLLKHHKWNRQFHNLVNLAVFKSNYKSKQEIPQSILF